MSKMNKKNKISSSRLPQLLLLTVLTPMFGCDLPSLTEKESDTVTTLAEGTKLVGLPVNKSKSLFTSDSSPSSAQYIRNHLINRYSKVEPPMMDYMVDGGVRLSDAVAESAKTETTTSTTNTIEENVDEADLIKAFSENGQDYLVTITQPEFNYFDDFLAIELEDQAIDAVEVDDVVAMVSESVVLVKREKTAAQLNLFTIDTSPSSVLLGTLSLNEDAYNVSGIYSYQNTLPTDVNSTYIIAQTSLREAPTDWRDYYAWRGGRTGVDATEVKDQTLTNAWSIVFDGHMLDSRRIDNHMYVALRHYSTSMIEGVVTPYYYSTDEEISAVIAKNIAVIEKLDIESLVPNMSITLADKTITSPVFDLDICHLPNDDERFLTGSVMFNYVAKIDLNSGDIVGVQCILSEMNQLYMNEKSLFLIDANAWSGQTSRLHRFNLTDLSYDTSLTIDGTLGWRSAQFRIKELNDGTVVALTSKPETESTSWCCWFTPDWVHKLQLFQKDDTQEYRKIAELPNEAQPDNDDTPQSLGKAGEDIYGVRIDENSVKVVTFQQTDPLYVFDITDRHNLAYAGELADSGFSSYLHSFGDLILGIGFNADENGRRQGLKVELYEADSTVAEGIVSVKEHSFGAYASTPAESNHHAFTSSDISDSETRIAIPATVYEGSSAWERELDYTGLLLFTLDKNKGTLDFDGTIKATKKNQWGMSSSWSDRSVIQHSTQGVAVHYIHLGEVISERWEDVE